MVVKALSLHEECATQNGTIHGDKGKKDAQGTVESRRKLLHDHLDQLYNGGDHRNEHDETQETQIDISKLLSQTQTG